MKAGDRRRKTDTSSSFGFTLLEMMIALAIIGITLTVILHTVNFHVNIMSENIRTTRMYQLAKEKMNDLESSPVDTKGKIKGTVFTYENIAIHPEDSGMIELKTIIRGPGKTVALKELVVKKAVW